jgi:hypothetical protein
MSNQAEPSGPNLAESMPAQAAEFAQVCKGKGINLDYLPRTLPLVDRVLQGARGEVQQLTAKQDPQAPELKKKNAMWITAYLGEVIRRETGATWYDYEDRALLDCGDYQADPATAVNDFFEQGKAHEGDLAIETTKAYCELICRMQRLWLDGTVLGNYESMSALRTAMTPEAKLAGWLVAQGQLAVKTAKLEWKESLDFSEDSLDAIERMMGKLHARSKAPGEGLAEEQLTQASNLWGTYVGEVIRRQYGGQWSTAPDGVLQLALSGYTAQPMVKVRNRIVNGAADNIRFYFATVAKALSS